MTTDGEYLITEDMIPGLDDLWYALIDEAIEQEDMDAERARVEGGYGTADEWAESEEGR